MRSILDRTLVKCRPIFKNFENFYHETQQLIRYKVVITALKILSYLKHAAILPHDIVGAVLTKDAISTDCLETVSPQNRNVFDKQLKQLQLFRPRTHAP